MTRDDMFEPQLGRLGAQTQSGGRGYLGQVLAARNRASGAPSGAGARSSFTGSRSGRAAGVGRMLAARGANAAGLRRRVLIKARIIKLAGAGRPGAVAHLRYLQRDGTTRDGAAGALYARDEDMADGKAFQARASGDRHQFRFIVAPEDGAEYDDLKPLTRRLMAQAEIDLGTRLDWVAVDHFNTGHPHTHVIVRGRDAHGRDLVIARDYLSAGLRERAAELVDLDLGPRSARTLAMARQAEIEQSRLTSIDRDLLRDLGEDRIVAARASAAFDQSLRAGRLAKLVRLGLAEPLPAGRFRLAPNLDATLRAAGERGDIIRTMQRAFASRGETPASGAHLIYDPTQADAGALVGRLVARGLADEHDDRYFAIVDASDGRSHYVRFGRGERLDELAGNAIVRVAPRGTGPRPIDQTVAAIAAASHGRYDRDAHRRHDPGASAAFIDSHVRRLEALRRAGVGPTRDSDGSWMIPRDHLDRVDAYTRAQLRDQPVTVTLLSPQPLARLIDADAATWLDRELTAVKPEPLRDAGFGRAVRIALDQRRQWLIAEGLADELGGITRYRSGMTAILQRRELLRVGGQLADELQRPFAEAQTGLPVDGVYRRSLDLLGGRHALIERAHDFTLVPWRPVLDRATGQAVTGLMRDGGIHWTIGRSRSGPAIS